ncbi:putative PHD type zinc finger protein with BAH domain-containing protein [Thoreauomyces humboldtii]|nr:putative PHD type zinc finger protein with BAH domain-containing protein [Thoreauomyces humboldtii]
MRPHTRRSGASTAALGLPPTSTASPAPSATPAAAVKATSWTKPAKQARAIAMANPKPVLTQYTAKDGVTYHINGIYYVGRVLEFTNGKLPGPVQTFVRIGWFYRPKDVLPGARKKNHDPRMLIASMHSDINPVSSIRGKCTVLHVHQVKNLDEWKLQDDRFYYDQLYDRYTHRVYDVVPLDLVKNLPSEVSKALDDYEFILVEAGKASDFTERRVCNSCDRWCNPDESVVKCNLCRGAYHLGCVGLPSKPRKGYAWQCAKCNKKVVDDAEEEEKALEKTSRGKSAPSKKPSIMANLKDEDDEMDVPMEVVPPIAVRKQGDAPTWPYRYFGEYAKYRETLSEEGPDLGHPRAASRIGKQFQADLPECVPYRKESRKDAMQIDPPSNNVSGSLQSSRPSIGTDHQVLIPDVETSTPRLEAPRKVSPRIGDSFQAIIPEAVPIRRGSVSIPHGLFSLDDTPRSSVDPTDDAVAGTSSPHGSRDPPPPPQKSAQPRPQNRARGRKKGKGAEPEVVAIPLETVEVQSRGTPEERTFLKPESMTDKQLSVYIAKIQDEVPTGIKCSDYLYNRALAELHKADYDIDRALAVMLKLKAKDLGVPTWSEAETKAFEGGIIKYGHELNLVHGEVPTKSMTEVVAYFYKWKKGRRYAPVYSQFCKKYRPGKRFKGQKHAMDGAADVEGNLSGDLSADELPLSPTKHSQGPSHVGHGMHSSRGPIECANCFVTESPKWKFRQKESKKEILCLACGIHFLKYGASRAVSEAMRKANKENAPKKGGKRKRSLERVQTSSANNKVRKRGRKGGPTTKIRTSETFVDDYLSSSPSPEDIHPRPCTVCSDIYEYQENKILTCKSCRLRVHRDCYGIPETCADDAFSCARCLNIASPECSLLYKCVLCPLVNAPRETALKRTIGNNWVHVSCATWMPEAKFGSPLTLEPVECIGLIEKKRWRQTCTICKQSTGACVTCSERNCPVAFHVSCAQHAGWELAIETVRGKGSSNDLQAVAFCGKHNHRASADRQLTGEALQALGTSIAESSLHQPTRLSVPTFVADNHVDLIDSKISRPRLLREYIVGHKAKSKHLATGGQMRAFSMALQRTCACHVCADPAVSTPSHQRQHHRQEPAVQPPPQKHQVITLSLGGRKISNSASTAAKSLAATALQPKTQPSQPPVVSRTCVDCNIAISPAWWNKAELLTQLGPLPAEEVVPVCPLSPPVVAPKPLSPAPNPLERPLSAVQLAGVPDQNSNASLITHLSDSSTSSDPHDEESLGRGMRKRRKSTIKAESEETDAIMHTRKRPSPPPVPATTLEPLAIATDPSTTTGDPAAPRYGTSPSIKVTPTAPRTIIKLKLRPASATSSTTAIPTVAAAANPPKTPAKSTSDLKRKRDSVEAGSAEVPDTQVEGLESVWLCHGCMWKLKDRAAAVAGKG